MVYPYIPRCLRSCAHVAAEDVSSVERVYIAMYALPQEDIVLWDIAIYHGMWVSTVAVHPQLPSLVASL